MKALVLHGIGDLRLEKVPLPVPGEDEVLVRIAACGVCGSDIPRIYEKGTYTFPTIPGHEFAGQVEGVGSGVDDLESGEAVAVFPLLWCGKCASCEVGKYVQCEGYGYLGSRNDGGFAEYVVAPRKNLLRVPDGVELEVAALTEPASVALHALRRVGTSLVGKSVAILGAGPIGLMVAQWARVMGIGQPILFDVADSKLDLARSLGFDEVHDSRDVGPKETIDWLTGRRGVDLAIDAAGVPDTLLAACVSAARGGSVVMLGNPSRNVEFPTSLLSKLMRREVSLLGTWNSDYSAFGNGDDWSTTLTAMAEGSLNLTPLVSHRVRLDEAIDALDQMRNDPSSVNKILILP